MATQPSKLCICTVQCLSYIWAHCRIHILALFFTLLLCQYQLSISTRKLKVSYILLLCQYQLNFLHPTSRSIPTKWSHPVMAAPRALTLQFPQLLLCCPCDGVNKVTTHMIPIFFRWNYPVPIEVDFESPANPTNPTETFFTFWWSAPN